MSGINSIKPNSANSASFATQGVLPAVYLSKNPPALGRRIKDSFASAVLKPLNLGKNRTITKFGAVGLTGAGLGAGGYAVTEHVILPAIHGASGKGVTLPIWAAVLISAAIVLGSVLLGIVLYKGAAAMVRKAKQYKENNPDIALYKATKKAEQDQTKFSNKSVGQLRGAGLLNGEATINGSASLNDSGLGELTANVLKLKLALDKVGGVNKSTQSYTKKGEEVRAKLWSSLNLPTDAAEAAAIDAQLLGY